MKITIDTRRKTIAINDRSSIGEVMKFMVQHFPKNWDKFKFEKSGPNIIDKTTVNNYNGDTIDMSPSSN
jgi:hypothetical protein